MTQDYTFIRFIHFLWPTTSSVSVFILSFLLTLWCVFSHVQVWSPEIQLFDIVILSIHQFYPEWKVSDIYKNIDYTRTLYLFITPLWQESLRTLTSSVPLPTSLPPPSPPIFFFNKSWCLQLGVAFVNITYLVLCWFLCFLYQTIHLR